VIYIFLAPISDPKSISSNCHGVSESTEQVEKDRGFSDALSSPKGKEFFKVSRTKGSLFAASVIPAPLWLTAVFRLTQRPIEKPSQLDATFYQCKPKPKFSFEILSQILG
jgi:hypothetical protein